MEVGAMSLGLMLILLVIVLGLFVLGGLAIHFFFKKHPIGRAIVRVVSLILLTIALLHADELHVRVGEDDPFAGGTLERGLQTVRLA